MGEVSKTVPHTFDLMNGHELEDFKCAFRDLQKKAHDTALEKGWWNPAKTFGEQLALFHSEVSEALEEYRNGHEPNEIYTVDEKPEGVPIELADLLIRVFDTCEYYDIDLIGAIFTKMEYNKTRSHRHGGKVI